MSNNLQTMALSVPHSGSIEGYIQAVSSIDMLSAEEELAPGFQFDAAAML